MRRERLLPILAVLLTAILPAGARAQTERDGLDAYFRVVGEHFRVSPQEVTILSEWRLTPDEVPVVLFLARRGGISPDAVVALRRGGRGWSELATRYGVGADDFHVPLGNGAGGSLAHAYEQFASTPSAGWPSLRLGDDDIIGLVNVRVLSEATGAPPARVIAARDQAGSYANALRALVRGG